MRTWMELTTAQIVKALEEHAGYRVVGKQGTKARLAGIAEAMLGPDADAPALVVPDATPVEVEYVPSVHQRIAAVIADLPAIGKDEQAPGNMGGYRYRGIEAITAALKPLLAKHGLMMVPSIIDRRDGERPTRGGGVMHVVDLLVRFSFYGDGGDSVEASMWGQGTDAGDKSPQKAVTSAFKSMLAVVFCIADAETDAERHSVPETDPGPVLATVEDIAALKAWMEAAPVEHQPTLQREAVERFGPSKDLEHGRVSEVIDWIEARTKELVDATPPPSTEGLVACPICAGTGLTVDPDEGHEEIVCPLCEGEKMVCVECGQRVEAHAEGCSRRPL